ncbi:transcription factor bHLH30-like [Malania oleifera]|uniref:transcription factor bHLH30-like n=1 Tax=Malania oleifera TaxID=397392 RepID=UPI0025AD9D1D|nr:transcription factor bHLH30-like [Malania oleifera]
MASFSWNSNPSCGLDFSNIHDLSVRNTGGFYENSIDGSSLSHAQSLVIDSEKGELVTAPVKLAKKGPSEAKVVAALKSHSEAERRRRQRINAHLTSLRGLVPCTDKMDKATLLAEVISEVKELKKKATEASKDLLIPMDTDEVRVEPHDDETKDGRFSFKASLCCDYRPELLSDLRQALDALHLNMVKAEISTLGCRVKNVFVFTGCKDGKGDNAEACQLLASSVHQALGSVLHKGSAPAEFSPRTTLPNKRRKVSLLDSSSSSS